MFLDGWMNRWLFNRNIFYQIFDKLNIMKILDILTPGKNPPDEINAVIEWSGICRQKTVYSNVLSM
jgi:hypothetical protein